MKLAADGRLYPFAAEMTVESVKEACRYLYTTDSPDFTVDDLQHEVLTAIAVSRLKGTDAILAAFHASDLRRALSDRASE